jgi:hypothetical protein
MVVVEKLRRSNLHKPLLLVLKYIPMVIALCYMLNTMLYIEPLSNIAGVSLLTWIFLYLASVVFEFCSYHRMFLWYILIDDVLNIVDYYWSIPISTDNLIRIHNILAGITLFIVSILYVKSNKVIIRKNNK